METRRKLKLAALALSCLMPLGCGTAEPELATGCSAGSAAIGVTDGQVAILCGCDEPGGSWVANASGLVCTVPSGTIVTFHYINPVNRHQIVSTPGEVDVFTPSAVHDPLARVVIRAHAVSLTGPGADFDFTDTFDSTLSGTISVR